MSLADKVLAVNNDLPIRTDQPVHSGKVRSVYWLTAEDSKRLIEEKGYNVAADAPLAIIMVFLVKARHSMLSQITGLDYLKSKA